MYGKIQTNSQNDLGLLYFNAPAYYAKHFYIYVLEFKFTLRTQSADYMVGLALQTVPG